MPILTLSLILFPYGQISCLLKHPVSSRQSHRPFLIGVRHKNDKLLSAVADHHIIEAHTSFQVGSEFIKYLVSIAVAVDFVDGFKIVYIQNYY